MHADETHLELCCYKEDKLK